MDKQEIFRIIIEKSQKGLELLQRYDAGEKFEERQTATDFLSAQDVIDLHDMIDGKGILNRNGLESAVYRPVQAETYSEPTIYELAILLAEGIIRNHPFADGNKRCAMLSMCAFLALNNQPVPENSEKIAETIIALAERKISMTDAAKYMEMCQSEYIDRYSPCLKQG